LVARAIITLRILVHIVSSLVNGVGNFVKNSNAVLILFGASFTFIHISHVKILISTMFATMLTTVPTSMSTTTKRHWKDRSQ
jgi:hypothetical protein